MRNSGREVPKVALVDFGKVVLALIIDGSDNCASLKMRDRRWMNGLGIERVDRREIGAQSNLLRACKPTRLRRGIEGVSLTVKGD
jgi:hypothetical protein